MKRGATVLVALLAGSCTDIPIGDGPRKTVVRRVASDVIAPAHAELATKTVALEAAVAALLAAPGPTSLVAAQDAWRAARAPWVKSLVFRVGPVIDDSYEAKLDQWPVDEGRIQSEIAGSAALTPSHVAGLGANKRGFHALELFLFDPAGGDAAVLAALTTDTLATRRGQYMAAVAALLTRDAGALHTAWDPAGGAFEERIVDIGGDGPFATVKDATDAVINDAIFLAELVADAKLGKPMGKMSGTPDVSLIESSPSDGALDDLRGHVLGLREVYVGASPDAGLSGLVAKASPAIDAHVRADLAALEGALAAIPRPFAAAVLARDTNVEAAWAAARRLRVTLSTEVIAALGATLSFNSNDGD